MDHSSFDPTDVRADGGAVNQPPLTAVSETNLQPQTLAENARRIETVVQLLNQPALTRVYVYVCYWGPVTPPDIKKALDLSKSTTYEYVDRLVDLDLVERDESMRPQQLTAEPLLIVEQYVPIVITPTVLHALALQEVDEDIAYFVDRHGVGKLIAALRGAGLNFAGNVTQRMLANDIDVPAAEGMTIVHALAPALVVGQRRDPYFEYLFPDVHDEIQIPYDIDDERLAPDRLRDDT